MPEARVVHLSAAPSFQRDVVHQNLLDQLDSVATQGRTAISNTIDVRAYLASGSEEVRRVARAMLVNLYELASKSLSNDDQPRPNRPVGAVTTIGRRIESVMDRAAASVPSRPHRAPRWMRYGWTFTGVALSGLTAYTIVAQNWWTALLLVALRVALSTAMGGGHDLPFEGRTTAGDSGTAIVARCMAGHITDVLPLLAVSFVFYTHGRSLWAVGAALVVVLMLISTMFRIAALQVGVRLPRHLTERAFRVGGMLIGLAAVCAWQTAVPAEGVPVLALFLAGAVTYTTIESARTLVRLHQADQEQTTTPRSVDLLFRSSHGVESYAFSLSARPTARGRSKAS